MHVQRENLTSCTLIQSNLFLLSKLDPILRNFVYGFRVYVHTGDFFSTFKKATLASQLGKIKEIYIFGIKIMGQSAG